MSSLAGQLGEKPILNLSEFDGCGARFVVIRHSIDPRADGIASHEPGIVGFQQFGDRCDVLHSGVEPHVVAVGIEDGRLDYAVNNAGIEGKFASITDLPEQEWDRVLDINLKGTFLCLQYEARAMIAGGHGGAIRRADIWAFGCLLYEMLTGKRAFGGQAVSETLAAVIRDDPYWSALPQSVPPRIRDLLKRCLCKDVRQRLQAIGERHAAIRVMEGRTKGRSDHPTLWAAGETHSPVSSYLSAYMPLPIEYVPVHVKTSEPSEFSFPVQPPEPLMPLYFPVPLTIFHLLETGLVGSVELDASYA